MNKSNQNQYTVKFIIKEKSNLRINFINTTMNRIVLSNFLNSKRILHSDATDFAGAMNFFLENEENSDAITYYDTRHFLLMGVQVLEIDKNGHHFFEISVKRHGDIVDNISVESLSSLNVAISYNIGGTEYAHSEIDEFVLVAGVYQDFVIRITFLQKPTIDSEFKIMSRYYILNSRDRKLLNQSQVFTRNCFYVNGVCTKNKLDSKNNSVNEYCTL